MSTLLIARANRALLVTIALMMITSLAAPIIAFASTDLVAGDSAVVSSPDGANLRSDTTVVDDTTLIAHLPEGTTVYVSDNPIYNDTGVWVYVATDGYGPGWVSAPLLSRLSADAPLGEPVANEPEEEAVVSDTPWLEPIDTAVVVDHNTLLTEQGLPVRATMTVDGPVLGYVPVASTLDVTAERVWVGENNFVQVNYNGQGGFVDGRFVELNSEAVPEEPVQEEIIYLDDETPTEEATVEEPVETEVVETEVVDDSEVSEPEEPATEEATETVIDADDLLGTEGPNETDVDDNQSTPDEDVVETEPVEGEPTETEEGVETEVSDNESTPEEAATEDVVETEPAEGEPTETEEAIETEIVDEQSTPEEVGTEDAVETEPVEDEATETEEATQEVINADDLAATEEVEEAEDQASTPEVVETEEATESGTPADSVSTEDPQTEATPAATDEAPVATSTEAPNAEATAVPTKAAPVATSTEAPKTEATAAPTKAAPVATSTQAPKAEPTTAPTKAATQTPTEEAKAPVPPKPAASTQPAFDAKTMIGSATVTGTSNGLICRAAPEAGAPVLMTLKEGTKVLEFKEATNGYLGIDCGGLQGFADVNFLWSGGAGDEEITKSNLSVVVTGTGNGLNCRSGAGLNHAIITTIFDGTKLTTRGKAANGWTPVICNGMNGFVSTTWIEVAAGSNSGSNTSQTGSTQGSATVNTGGDVLNCRSGAGTSYPVITTLRSGAAVTVTGAKQGAWVPVSCGGQKGWVHGDYVNVTSAPKPGATTPGNSSSTAGRVTVANTGGMSLNCRSGAGTSYPVIAVLSLGTTVTTRSGSVSGWTAVTCSGQNGFVSSEFVTGGSANTTPPKTSTPPTTSKGTMVVNTGGDALNCRTGAGTSYSVITSLAHGTTVTTRGTAVNGWVPITCGGSNGFAHSDYLAASSSKTPTSPTPTPTPTQPTGLKSGDNAKVTSTVNLRYSASSSAGVSTSIQTGTVIQITGSLTSNFYPVNYDGLTGYVHQDYLVKTSEAPSKRGGSGTPSDPQPAPPTTGSPTGNALVNYAMRYVGYPYVWATHGPSSFDCSGFTYWVVFNVTGKNIGYGTWTQVAAGSPVSKSNLQPGDLVFFQNTYTAGLSHVGLYIGNGKFIHAQNEETGVVVSELDSSYYGPRWYGAVRIN